MEEYVAKSVLKKELNIANLHSGIVSALQNIVDEIPAADVREVKRGYWETYEEEVYGIVPTEFKVCSKCGKEYDSVFMSACCADFEKDTIQFHYCPYCGAKMDGKDEENVEHN